MVDEVVTRDLQWEPTDHVDRDRPGHKDTDHREITEAEADEFVRRVTGELGRCQWSMKCGCPAGQVPE